MLPENQRRQIEFGSRASAEKCLDLCQDFSCGEKAAELAFQHPQNSAVLGLAETVSRKLTPVFGTGIRRFESSRPSHSESS